jgi:tetrahydromethanopterin S-methyltransferase subunit F
LGEEVFEREVLQRLTRIETNQQNISDQCTPCRSKVDSLEIAVSRVESSAKSAHHRIDTMQVSNVAVKEELITAIKEQISGIYRTAGMLGALAGFFVAVIMWVIKH